MSKQAFIQTDWCVITGAPCSGKSTIIGQLAQKGYPVLHEVARAFIDEQLESGLTLEAITADEEHFERQILYRKLEAENRLDPSVRVFLDRALPDSIAYYRMGQLNPEEPERLSKRFRYHRVFILEALPFVKDRVRREDTSRAMRIARLLKECYCALGYSPVSVPVLPVGERVDFILNRACASYVHI